MGASIHFEGISSEITVAAFFTKSVGGQKKPLFYSAIKKAEANCVGGELPPSSKLRAEREQN